MRAIFISMVILYAIFTFNFPSTYAQVNFSPAWGKRASSDMLGDISQDQIDFKKLSSPDACQTPLECMIRLQQLYRYYEASKGLAST